jgi:ATP-dependent protease ClpP protease subunit
MPKKIDLSDLFKPQSNQDERISSRPIANLYEFYLVGEIEPAENYIEWFNTIRNCSDMDVIKININSGGGDLFSAVQLLSVLRQTEALKVVFVEGACMSAATIPLMVADEVHIAEHSMIMLHDYSGGVVGKGGEMFDQLAHERKWSENLIRDIYEGFLTEEEFQSLLQNRDLWMSGEDVLKRLKSRQAYFEAKEKAEEAEKEKPEVETFKKPRKKKESDVHE